MLGAVSTVSRLEEYLKASQFLDEFVRARKVIDLKTLNILRLAKNLDISQ